MRFDPPFDDLGFRVLVKEIGPASQASQFVQSSINTLAWEAMGSNEGVLGFEDIDDGIAYADEDQGKLERLDLIVTEAAGDHEVVKETTNVPKGIEQFDGSHRGSLNSTSRTKTTVFSKNGFSEKLIKISKHVPSLGLEAEEQQPVEEAYHDPPGSFANDHAIINVNNGCASPQTALEKGVLPLPPQPLEGDLSRRPGFDSPEGTIIRCNFPTLIVNLFLLVLHLPLGLQRKIKRQDQKFPTPRF